MQMTIQEGSNYFRGLLLLIRKDQKITDVEIALLKRVGKSFGFEKMFCENAASTILENNYILDKPPVFSSLDIAKKFITDGLTIAQFDHEIHISEERWLQIIALANNIPNEWFVQEKERIQQAYKKNELIFDDLIVEYLK